MARKQSNAPKVRSQKKRGQSARGKSKATKTRKPTVRKGQNQKSSVEVGRPPKSKSSKDARGLDRAVKGFQNAKSKRELGRFRAAIYRAYPNARKSKHWKTRISAAYKSMGESLGKKSKKKLKSVRGPKKKLKSVRGRRHRRRQVRGRGR